LKAFGASGGRVGAIAMNSTAAAVVIPAAVVGHCNGRHAGSARNRRRNTKQLTGDRANTSAPNTFQ